MSESVGEYQVLYSSYLLKRNKSHSWQKKWFVLRRNQLAYYKDSKEYKASRIISNDDILSINEIPDNHKHHFIIVTGTRIYHLKALDQKSYDSWLEIVGGLLAEREHTGDRPQQAQQVQGYNQEQQQEQESRQIPTLREDEGFQYLKPPQSSLSISPGGNHQNELGSIPLSGTDDNFTSDGASRTASLVDVSKLPPTATLPRVIPEESNNIPTHEELETNLRIDNSVYYNSLSSSSPDHVIAKGYLLRLKKRYNQWKKYYIILTNHFLLFFKSPKDAETSKFYKKINVRDILDAVELDPLSRSKLYCMLIITPIKRIRFCAETEEELTRWLVLLKTIVKTRKLEEKQHEAKSN